MNLSALYDPLPDPAAYLERIQCDFSNSLTKVYLDHLIFQHQLLIPFENLDIIPGGRLISLEIPDLYRKIVRQKRGGYCFELNSLFFSLLTALGYQAYPVLCKVLEGSDPYYPALHRATVVRIGDSSYYCDVGFGGPVPGGALEIQTLHPEKIAMDTYRLVSLPHQWLQLERLSKGRYVPMLRICLQPQDPADFLALSHYCCCQAQEEFNHFTEGMLLNIRLRNGYAALNGPFLHVVNGDEDSCIQKRIHEKEEMDQVLTQIFRLPEHLLDHLTQNEIRL